jgi:hypothetical protein
MSSRTRFLESIKTSRPVYKIDEKKLLEDAIRKTAPSETLNTQIHYVSDINIRPDHISNLHIEYTKDPEFSDHCKELQNPYHIHNGILYKNHKV